MKTCKTCKYREENGYCQSDKIVEAHWEHTDAEKRDMLIYSYDEGGGFWVGEDFGCIHHREINE